MSLDKIARTSIVTLNRVLSEISMNEELKKYIIKTFCTELDNVYYYKSDEEQDILECIILSKVNNDRSVLEDYVEYYGDKYEFILEAGKDEEYLKKVG